MNEVSEAIARWLEQKRRTDRASTAVISVLALGSGAAVFILATLLIYGVLSIVCGAFVHSVPSLGRVKECHPDLFAGMDQQAKALAERWTRALNAAYATLNPRHEGARPSSTARR